MEPARTGRTAWIGPMVAVLATTLPRDSGGQCLARRRRSWGVFDRIPTRIQHRIPAGWTARVTTQAIRAPGA